MPPLTRILLFTALASAPFGLVYAQGSYEIQVYGSELVSPGATMFELHSNFTFEGSKTVVDGQYPTEHQLHETLEITHGFSDWFELAARRRSRNRGSGRWESVCRRRSVISGPYIRRTRG
jgi:hypothetical protein